MVDTSNDSTDKGSTDKGSTVGNGLGSNDTDSVNPANDKKLKEANDKAKELEDDAAKLSENNVEAFVKDVQDLIKDTDALIHEKDKDAITSNLKRLSVNETNLLNELIESINAILIVILSMLGSTLNLKLIYDKAKQEAKAASEKVKQTYTTEINKLKEEIKGISKETKEKLSSLDEGIRSQLLDEVKSEGKVSVSESFREGVNEFYNDGLSNDIKFSTDVINACGKYNLKEIKQSYILKLEKQLELKDKLDLQKIESKNAYSAALKKSKYNQICKNLKLNEGHKWLNVLPRTVVNLMSTENEIGAATSSVNPADSVNTADASNNTIDMTGEVVPKGSNTGNDVNTNNDISLTSTINLQNNNFVPLQGGFTPAQAAQQHGNAAKASQQHGNAANANDTQQPGNAANANDTQQPGNVDDGKPGNNNGPGTGAKKNNSR